MKEIKMKPKYRITDAITYKNLEVLDKYGIYRQKLVIQDKDFAELVCRLLNENEDLKNGNYHSVYSEPKEHCMGHQTIHRKGEETILAETFSDEVAKIIVKAMNENENRLNEKIINYIRRNNGN